MCDSTVQRYTSFGPNFDSVQSMLGQGIIRELLGMEIRQSTLPVNRASGSSGATTYHAWAYKKGLAAALAASRDVMLEPSKISEFTNIMVASGFGAYRKI